MSGINEVGGARYISSGEQTQSAPIATVRVGETTLAQVAHRLHLSLESLIQANPQIHDPNHVTAGQDIRLPQPGALVPETSISSGVAQTALLPPEGIDDPLSKSIVLLTLLEAMQHNGMRTQLNSAAVKPGGPAPLPSDVPTAQSVFGPHPWMQAPTGNGPGGASWQYNPIYFATRQTANKVAAMLGGKVVQRNYMQAVNGITQAQPNLMVEMPDGRLINPGQIADFYNHGYTRERIDQMIEQEVNG